jgi:hypothetical protein
MSIKIRFNSAVATGLVLAKVGNPQRDEPLQTSKEVFHIEEADRPVLTGIFLKPFKNLIPHRFTHHSSLDQHEMNTIAKSIFSSEDGLLEKGCDIAKRLYSKSYHPNIKEGDLCISLVKDIEVDGVKTQGLCILKSESVVPFLSISTRDGDLKLSTEQGINPEKIDKGCLIVDHAAETGYYVLTFDRTGTDSRFWVRDFLGLQAVTDAAFLTKSYADMAVSFLKQEAPSEGESPEKVHTTAHEAMAYFEKRDTFNLEEFEEEVLKTPEAAAKFAEHRAQVEEEQGQPLEKSFSIAKKQLTKAKKRIGSVLKLDAGIEIHLKPAFGSRENNPLLERGEDAEKGMKFIKLYYHKEDAGQ